MKQIQFKCKACDKYVEMNRSIPYGFEDWAYFSAEWLDLEEEVPQLSEKHFARSSHTPKVGELHSIKVHMPFDEMIGNEVNIEFIPAMAYFNGFDEYPEEIHNAAIVRCRIEKILLIDEYSAWLRIRVTEVTMFSELYKKYCQKTTNEKLEKFAGISECTEIELNNKHWKIISWSGQGDIGEQKLIYIDDDNVRHLVAMTYYDFHEEILYLGNIVQNKNLGLKDALEESVP